MNERPAWTLTIALTGALFLAARAGWAPRRIKGLMQLGLLAIPIIIKSGHSVSLWLQQEKEKLD